MCLLGLISANAITLSWRRHWWSEAARTTQQMLTDIQLAYPRLPTNSVLVIINMPENIHQALLRNLMPYALWLLYEDRSIHVFVRMDIDGVLTSEREILEFANRRTKGKKSIIFSYEGGHLKEFTQMYEQSN